MDPSPTDRGLLHRELKLVPGPEASRRNLLERSSSTCAVFLLMAVGSTPLPARGLQLTCQLLLTPGGAGRPCFEVEPTGSCCQEKSVQIYWVAEGTLQAMPPGQREGLGWGEVKAPQRRLAPSTARRRVEPSAGDQNGARVVGRVWANPGG